MITNLKHNLMQRSRLKKYNDFINFARLTESDKILDIDPANIEYSPYDNFLEKKYPFLKNISALSDFSNADIFKKNYPDVNIYYYNKGAFPFRDNQFKISYSNAVIEHVGSYESQLTFIKESYRVSEKIYLTTPAREFPIETHTNYPFIHYFNKKKYDSIVSFLGKSWAAGDYINLLSKKTITKLMKESKITKYKIKTNYMGFLPVQHIIFAWK